MASFFLMFLLMASARGALSASTKLCAREAVSIPEPLPRAFNTFWPLAALLVALLVLLLVLVEADELEVDETEVTMVCLWVLKN